jgi:hypothetical protein
MPWRTILRYPSKCRNGIQRVSISSSTRAAQAQTTPIAGATETNPPVLNLALQRLKELNAPAVSHDLSIGQRFRRGDFDFTQKEHIELGKAHFLKYRKPRLVYFIRICINKAASTGSSKSMRQKSIILIY